MDGSPITLTMWQRSDYVKTEGLKYGKYDHTFNIKSSSMSTTIWKLSLPSVSSISQSSCTALYFISIFEFFWMNIFCNKKMGHPYPKWHFICEQKENNTTPALVSNRWCWERRSILVSSYCIIFKNWYPLGRIKESRDIGEILNNLNKSQYFHILLSKYFQNSTIVLTEVEDRNEKHNKLIELKKVKLLHPDIYRWDITFLSDIKMKQTTLNSTYVALNILESAKEDVKCHPGAFLCGDKSCILSQYICDNIRHCLDGADEENTTCFQMKLFIEFGKHFSRKIKQSFVHDSHNMRPNIPKKSAKTFNVSC